MNNILNSTYKIVENSITLDNKNELLECLSKLKDELLIFQSIKDENEFSSFKDNSDVTKEQIEEEKKNYLIKRYNAKFDID